MPPIPIYADAPITAAKADGITPQTAPPPTRTTREAPTTTSASSTTSGYPAAQPGAAAVPAPTSSVPRPQPAPAPAPSRTIPSSATDGPPPPQPGAVPVPPTATASSSNGPASPRALPMPHQLSIPPPTPNYAATHTTTTASPSRGPTTIPLGPVSPQRLSLSSHPPGYVQNPYAAEMTSAQRASLEAAEAEDRGRRSGRNSISEFFAGDRGDGFGGGSPTTAKAWDAVKGLGSQVGGWMGKANDYATKKFG